MRLHTRLLHARMHASTFMYRLQEHKTRHVRMPPSDHTYQTIHRYGSSLYDPDTPSERLHGWGNLVMWVSPMTKTCGLLFHPPICMHVWQNMRGRAPPPTRRLDMYGRFELHNIHSTSVHNSGCTTIPSFVYSHAHT